MCYLYCHQFHSLLARALNHKELSLSKTEQAWIKRCSRLRNWHEWRHRFSVFRLANRCFIMWSHDFLLTYFQLASFDQKQNGEITTILVFPQADGCIQVQMCVRCLLFLKQPWTINSVSLGGENHTLCNGPVNFHNVSHYALTHLMV